jgi:membrane protease YdiL (CAAX protease family)
MRKAQVRVYGKAIGHFLLIPWLINFFVPLSIFLPFSSTIEKTHPPAPQLKIMGAVLSLIVVLCYLLLGKYIEKKLRESDESSDEGNNAKSVKEICYPKKGDLLLYSLASLALPLLVYCLQNILGVSEGQPSINLYQLPIALAIGPVIEEYLFRKILYFYCIKHGIHRFVFLSAVFFTLIHGYSISWAAAVLFLGTFVFAYFFLATLYVIYRSIYIPLQMHICWNLSVFLIGMFRVDTMAPAACFTVSLLILLYAIYRIIKITRLLPKEAL